MSYDRGPAPIVSPGPVSSGGASAPGKGSTKVDATRTQRIRVLERELRAALDQYRALERKAQSGDKAAAHELRRASARVLGLSRQLIEIDETNPALDDVPIELTGDTVGVGSLPEDLVRVGFPEMDFDVPGVQPTLCERDDVPDAAACFMSETQRTRVADIIGNYAQTNASRWNTAVLNAVDDELLNNHNGWGMVEEILFNVAAYSATGLIAKSAAYLSKTKLPQKVVDALTKASDPKAIKDYVAVGSKGVREKLKRIVTTKPNVSKIEVLRDLQDIPGAWEKEIVRSAYTRLDDAALLAMMAALDVDLPEHSTAAYEAQIRDIAAGMKKNVLAVGEYQGPANHATTFAARISAPDGETRIALVRYDKMHEVISRGDKLVFGDNHYHFVRWVDTEYAAAALERQRSLFMGGVPMFAFPTNDLDTGGDRLQNRDDPALVDWLKKHRARFAPEFHDIEPADTSKP